MRVVREALGFGVGILVCLGGLAPAAHAFVFTQAPGSPYEFTGSPDSAVVGDFNGDGRPDFAVAAELFCRGCDQGSASVFLGDSTGGFTRPRVPGADMVFGSGPVILGSADLNGDRKLDIVATQGTGIWIELGNGDGTFAATAESPIQDGHGPVRSVTGDFNGDGEPDLAVLNYDSTVSVLLGHGDGTFTEAPRSPVTIAGSQGRTIAVSDVNRDGSADLLVASGNPMSAAGSGRLSVLLGQENGTFTPAPQTPVAVPAADPSTIAVSDVNGDGVPDVAIAGDTQSQTSSSGSVEVLLGRGDGSFTSAPGSPLVLNDSGIDGAAAADFNQDGHADLAFAGNTAQDSGPRALYLLLGDGIGRFRFAHGSPFDVAGQVTPPSPDVFAAGMFDGRPGVLVAPAICCALYGGQLDLLLAPRPSDPPFAALTVTPSRVSTGARVSLDASASSDPLDRGIVDYRWDLGNGRFDHDTGTTPTIVWTYATPGAPRVRVQITNSAGETATASAQLVVPRSTSAPRHAVVTGSLQVCGGPAHGRCHTGSLRLCMTRRGCLTPDRVAAVNLRGKRVAVQSLTRGRFRLRLAPGRYAIELLGDGRRVHGRVMQRKRVMALGGRTATVRFRYLLP